MMKLLVALTLLAAANAECPNACSGHGTCGKYDMCTCFDRWTNNDCGERVCPYGFSFVTTPQGDLNMDGDRYDNTQKLLVKQIGGAANTGSITENDNVLTLDSTIAGTAAEDLIVGDAVRVGAETFVATAVSGNLITLDHDRYTTISSQNVYKFVESIQAPKGTWESWVGDFNEDDEGHYYMECSNRGLCDRKEGTCTCFDGYDGSACQRQACPNDCSGHGTCETVAELAVQNATQYSAFHVEAATAGSASITLTRSPDIASDPLNTYGALSVGDVISLGKAGGQQLTVKTITDTATTSTITTDPATTNSFMHGTRVYGLTKYDLWDANKDRACMCDYSYTGADCSMRDCPHGDDPLTKQQSIASGWIKGQMYAKDVEAGWTTASAALTAAQQRHGTASFMQRNEKQNIYLDTMRGSLSGSFTLTFTDAFGQKWTTTAIDVNGRLSSKAFIGTSMATVTFSPALPYGELKAGDFLMIGDERQEVLTVYPEADTTTSRPVKLGGVVDSVLVRNVFGQVTTDAYAFRAGPAKGIEDALEALPNGVIGGVTTETFNAGSLIGHAREGISTYNGMSYFQGLMGDYENEVKSTTIGDHGENYAKASTNGGLAPYDMVRVTGASGFSEFVQLRHVDLSGTSGDLLHATAKGTLTAQTQANSGIGAGKTGAIYRQGGYHVRVSFDTNSGDLQELDVDTSGLYSVFYREFTGTVSAKEPTRVVARTHGSKDILVNGDSLATAKQQEGSGKYPVPTKYFSETTANSGLSEHVQAGNADFTVSDTFRGAEFDLKVMAGMKVKIADQVRTVVSDIADSETSVLTAKHVAAFFVDAPFEANSQSRRVGEDDYIFFEYPVEQLYDQGTYNALMVAQTIFISSNQYVRSLVGSAVNHGGMQIELSASASTASAATVATTGAYPGLATNAAHRYTGRDNGGKVTGYASPFASVLGAGNTWVVNQDAGAGIATCALTPSEFTTIDGINTFLMAAGMSVNVHATNVGVIGTAAGTGTKGCVFRSYKSLNSFEDESGPPLQLNGQSRWALVTDQRPLRWNAPAVAASAVSTVTFSLAGVSGRGVMGPSGGTLSATLNAGGATGTYIAVTTPSSVLFTFNGWTNPSSTPVFAGLGLAANEYFYMTISGCTVDTKYNQEYLAQAASSTTIAVLARDTSAAYSAAGVYTAVAGYGYIDANDAGFCGGSSGTCTSVAMCTGDTITITGRQGSLIDSKAIAIGDRIKVKRAATLGSYDTRTVDKIWGTGLDVSMFSVVDAFDTAAGSLVSVDGGSAWVDESGTSEDLTCSRRGLCDGDTGVCACFAGYTTANCGTQNALAS